jgi:hypothetical protein
MPVPRNYRAGGQVNPPIANGKQSCLWRGDHLTSMQARQLQQIPTASFPNQKVPGIIQERLEGLWRSSGWMSNSKSLGEWGVNNTPAFSRLRMNFHAWQCCRLAPKMPTLPTQAKTSLGSIPDSSRRRSKYRESSDLNISFQEPTIPFPGRMAPGSPNR